MSPADAHSYPSVQVSQNGSEYDPATSSPLLCTGVLKQVYAQREANGLLKALANPKDSSKDCGLPGYK